MRRVGIVDISCQSKGYVISLSHASSKSTMSALDFSDSYRTHQASVDLARGRGQSTQGRALQDYSRPRPAATDRGRRQADAPNALHGQGLEHRAPVPTASRVRRGARTESSLLLALRLGASVERSLRPVACSGPAEPRSRCCTTQRESSIAKARPAICSSRSCRPSAIRRSKVASPSAARGNLWLRSRAATSLG